MKNLLKSFLWITLTGLTACTSARFAAKQNTDDVYYSPSDDAYSENQTPPSTPPEDYTSTEQNSTPTPENYKQSENTNNSGGNVTNNYYGDYNDYNPDDYYDYAYSSRIKRFHNPVYSCSYYDPWYTNVYWYDYNPVYYGSSIYLGYSWWYPSPLSWNFGWNSYNGWNVGWNLGYYPYGHCGNGYYGIYNYYPFYGYSNPYWNGYNNGYYNGYNDGLIASNNYYNSYDPNSYYHGHRGSISSDGGRERRTLAENYQNAVGSEKAFNSKFSDSPRSSDLKVDPNRNPGISVGSKREDEKFSPKNNPVVAPKRNSDEFNTYTSPKGLNQKGGNDYSIPKSDQTTNDNNYKGYSTPKGEPGRIPGNGNNGNYNDKTLKNSNNENIQPTRNNVETEKLQPGINYPGNYSRPKESRPHFFEPKDNSKRNNNEEFKRIEPAAPRGATPGNQSSSPSRTQSFERNANVSPKFNNSAPLGAPSNGNIGRNDSRPAPSGGKNHR